MKEADLFPCPLVAPKDEFPWKNCLPVITSLKVAAGYWGQEQTTLEENPGLAEYWISLPEGIKPEAGMFVTQIHGESMNRVAPNGSWCLFKPVRAGSRQGKRVLILPLRCYGPETGKLYIQGIQF